MANSKLPKADCLTVTQLVKKLEEFADIRPDADVCFITAGDGVNDGWSVWEVALVIDSGSARVLLANEEKVIE